MLRSIRAECTPQRLVAGFVFVPLLAYTINPFNELDLSYPLRLSFWTGLMALAVLAVWSGRKFALQRFGHLGMTARNYAVALMIMAFFTPVFWVFTVLLFTACGYRSPGFSAVGAYGVLLGTGLVLVSKSIRSDSAEQRPTESARLVRRLPEGFSGDILRLSARGHHVDVVTTQGVFTVRLRLSDAVVEMDPVVGHCAHRSHWVAEAAVEGVEKAGGKLFLRLCNGDLVPVSRKYKPDLEAAGLV
ncbi:transcriptional regulator, LytTR family [Ruegeria intermedia]|uniref:Transcriptional regulator, LytTR family n=1 Tax=Ruegeria intermedia TaxID=996115 RepID=A0A1M4X290_9RHOB|nr:LytTR family DNA-binding domain-containing protein [Ruegeria intermedia]SHE87595.1 transcriptional regulator, LytTR family [Ruegeria intermedia]